MIATELMIYGDAGWLTEQDLPAFPRRHVGVIFRSPTWRTPAMFKLPAYDPVVIAWLGFGILAITTLAFVS